MRFSVDELNKQLRNIQKAITEHIKKSETAEALLSEKTKLEAEKEKAESLMEEKALLLDQKLNTIGNIVHESVPDSATEDDNEVIRFWHGESGNPPQKGQGLLSHDQVLQRLDGYDPERGANVCGHRGYFLKNWGVRLNQALIQYGLDFLLKLEYILLQTPFLMKKEMMMKTAQLEDFDEQLFKVFKSYIRISAIYITHASCSVFGLFTRFDRL